MVLPSPGCHHQIPGAYWLCARCYATRKNPPVQRYLYKTTSQRTICYSPTTQTLRQLLPRHKQCALRSPSSNSQPSLASPTPGASQQRWSVKRRTGSSRPLALQVPALDCRSSPLRLIFSTGSGTRARRRSRCSLGSTARARSAPASRGETRSIRRRFMFLIGLSRRVVVFLVAGGGSGSG